MCPSLLQVNTVVERYFGVFNSGTVEIQTRLELDNDNFSLGRFGAVTPLVGPVAGRCVCVRTASVEMYR